VPSLPDSSPRLRATQPPPDGRWSRSILAVTVVQLAAGGIACVLWRLTGNDAWVVQFFQVPTALLLVFFCAIELRFCLLVLEEFSPGQALRTGWDLIAWSAACDVAGSLAAQIFSVHSLLNPLARMGWWSDGVAGTISQYGHFMGGTCRFALLALGLRWALKAYREAGFLARLTRLDWTLLAMTAIYIVREAWDLVQAMHHGARPDLGTMLGWPVDILLWLLAAQTLLLYRSVRRMGAGKIARCWNAFSLGVFLMVLGDLGIWAQNYGFLPWPWSSMQWYIWLPAAAAFALAPIYQWEAIQAARFPGPPEPPRDTATL
jgi:hypothetical protein